jgi:spore coat polysaccharide biosynthesis protein SpsF
MNAAIITARMGSSRLPGKVMLDLAGAPMLQRMVERVRRAELVDKVVVATTGHPADDIIADLCRRMGCGCFRGAEHDVMDRVLRAAQEAEAAEVVHLTGDCPFADAELIDATVAFFRANSFDYVGNNLNGTFPIGLDVRMFATQALRDAAARTSNPVDRVHVTYYLYMHPERYAVGGWDAPQGMYAGYRLTVDEFADYRLALTVFRALSRQSAAFPSFSVSELMAFLKDNPAIAALNAHVRQKAPEEG